MRAQEQARDERASDAARHSRSVFCVGPHTSAKIGFGEKQHRVPKKKKKKLKGETEELC